MDEQIFQTLIVGIVIFVLQNILIQFVIQPYRNFISHLANIECLLMQYAYLVYELQDERLDLEKEFVEFRSQTRRYAGLLLSEYTQLFCFQKNYIRCCRKVQVVPACGLLINLSFKVGHTFKSEEVLRKLREELQFNSQEEFYKI